MVSIEYKCVLLITIASISKYFDIDSIMHIYIIFNDLQNRHPVLLAQSFILMRISSIVQLNSQHETWKHIRFSRQSAIFKHTVVKTMAATED